MPMKPIIEIKNLNAGYDSRTVLRDISLTVYDRDFLGIIGPNGGGKTTLIKCILGLLKPSSGEIIFTSSRMTGNSQLTMGYLPQYNSIDRKFPITVEEVILSGLSSKKPLTSRFTKEHREKASQVIVRMGLEVTGRTRHRHIERWSAPTCPTGPRHHLRSRGSYPRRTQHLH